MIVVEERMADTVILVPNPGIDSSTAKQFEDVLLSSVDKAGGKVLVDFSQLDYISSAGLRAVLMGAKKAKQLGGRLMLCAMKGHIRTVFDTSGFSQLIPITATREQALAASNA